MDLKVRTGRRRQVIVLTDQINSLLPERFHGVAMIFALHSTVAITTANLDPGTDLDLLDALDLLIPDRPWRHPHDPLHAPDHLLASIIGPSVSLPVRVGRLLLGEWQQLVLVELAGPRERSLRLELVASQA